MRARAIIHLGRFAHNFREVQRRVGAGRRICVPVKADAYGHGAVQISRAGLKAGASCLAVAAVEEGKELREAGIGAPVLLFSQPLPDEIPAVVRLYLSPFVSDAEFADALSRQAAAEKIRLPVHLKIDTGMGRMGCCPADAAALARHIADCPGLEYSGTATHFAVSDSAAPDDIAYTRRQTALFREALDEIRAAGVDPGIVHAANSGAVILHPDAWFDMVRPGILLYGYKQAENSGAREPAEQSFSGGVLRVQPVMELRASVVFIKKVKKGESLSYGRVWTARRDTVAAVLSVGYGDGLPLLAGGKWQAVIRGKAYPLAGRICMDQCLADLGPEPEAARWDEAVIFGGEAPDAAALARRIGTIPYEITCNINKRVARVYED